MVSDDGNCAALPATRLGVACATVSGRIASSGSTSAFGVRRVLLPEGLSAPNSTERARSLASNTHAAQAGSQGPCRGREGARGGAQRCGGRGGRARHRPPGRRPAGHPFPPGLAEGGEELKGLARRRARGRDEVAVALIVLGHDLEPRVQPPLPEAVRRGVGRHVARGSRSPFPTVGGEANGLHEQLFVLSMQDVFT